MKTIHKHRLKVVNEVQELRLPEEGKVLRVDYIPQEAIIFMWVEVDADTVIDTPKEVRTFKVFNTAAGLATKNIGGCILSYNGFSKAVARTGVRV